MYSYPMQCCQHACIRLYFTWVRFSRALDLTLRAPVQTHCFVIALTSLSSEAPSLFAEAAVQLLQVVWNVNLNMEGATSPRLLQLSCERALVNYVLIKFSRNPHEAFHSELACLLFVFQLGNMGADEIKSFVPGLISLLNERPRKAYLKCQDMYLSFVRLLGTIKASCTEGQLNSLEEEITLWRRDLEREYQSSIVPHHSLNWRSSELLLGQHAVLAAPLLSSNFR